MEQSVDVALFYGCLLIRSLYLCLLIDARRFVLKMRKTGNEFETFFKVCNRF